MLGDMAVKLAALAMLALVEVANAQPGATEPTEAVPELQPPSSVEVTPPVRPLVVHQHNAYATTERWGGGVRLTGISGIGALPGVNWGGEIGAYLRRDEVFAELSMGRLKPQHTYIADAMSKTELGLDTWTLRAGWASMTMPLRGWLLVEVGEVAGASEMPGVVTRMMTGDTPQDHRWRAAGGGIGVAWPIADTVRLLGSLELAIPFGSDGGAMLDGGTTYKPDPLAARYSVGVEVGWH